MEPLAPPGEEKPPKHSLLRPLDPHNSKDLNDGTKQRPWSAESYQDITGFALIKGFQPGKGRKMISKGEDILWNIVQLVFISGENMDWRSGQGGCQKELQECLGKHWMCGTCDNNPRYSSYLWTMG
ncbi:hypothetical protein CRENBAI_017806 [Crenichthys baileyi]|uniref:Uncharacterized protein n=1 Tax=Crenichthys baileyi TaxID=28760 RepID=A0AAV9SHS3_9TELE